ncbi:MAG TPA: class I SAM-dependent methyltransferase [Aggregatilineales bacterium]|nr:class I SAM-dependent methyltransferase [Aggregatilineales bacterium]
MAEHDDPYDAIVRYYDAENADLTEDLPAYRLLVERFGGPVLELGAGTGRVALALAELGMQVAGVEPSAAMLERARERAQGSPAGNNITWHQMDAASFTLDQRFRLAIIPFGGFTHLLTQGEQLSALRQVAAHLEPGGGLAVDVGNPIGALRGDDLPVLAYERTFPDPQTGQPVMQQWLKTIDRATQVEEITWVYDRVGPGGEVFRSVVPMKMRHTPAPEMRLLLALGGFRDVEFYGDYDFNPYSEESPRLFTVAARGEADL